MAQEMRLARHRGMRIHCSHLSSAHQLDAVRKLDIVYPSLLGVEATHTTVVRDDCGRWFAWQKRFRRTFSVDGEASRGVGAEHREGRNLGGGEAARKHGLKVAEVEEWRERFLLAAENALRTRPRDDEALKDEEDQAAEAEGRRAGVGPGPPEDGQPPPPYGPDDVRRVKEAHVDVSERRVCGVLGAPGSPAAETPWVVRPAALPQ